jgi:hypothetical protein|tara:strand:+ start:256 stop:639 length:384 start_codon:yes stop_codon:yes gene_type:complete
VICTLFPYDLPSLPQGAARVKDTLSIYHCNTSAYHCDDVAVHYRGSLGNHTDGVMSDDANIFACDGVPKKASDEGMFSTMHSDMHILQANTFCSISRDGRSEFKCKQNLYFCQPSSKHTNANVKRII